MKATCPKQCPAKRFITVAHVTEDWVVDEAGNFLETGAAGETTHGPDAGNIWVCETCGEEATVKEE